MILVEKLTKTNPVFRTGVEYCAVTVPSHKNGAEWDYLIINQV